MQMIYDNQIYFFNFYIPLIWERGAQVCHTASMEVRGQLSGVDSLTVWVPGTELGLSAWHFYPLSYLTSPQPDSILIPASLTGCSVCLLLGVEGLTVQGQKAPD